MMVAPIVRRLIEEFGPGTVGTKLLDPFCGSGSALVESMLHGMESTGIDINPLACIMARVKTTPLAPERLQRLFDQIAESYSKLREPKEMLSFPNIDYWYPPSSVRDLSRLRELIMDISDRRYRDFFLLSLGETARTVSWTRHDEFKMYRMPEERRATWKPNVLGVFTEICRYNIERMRQFVGMLPAFAPTPRIILGDSRDPRSYPDEQYDLIVTSPPYGDSQTTAAYGQFSRLALLWIGEESKDVAGLDRRMLGGRPAGTALSGLGSPTLKSSLAKIGARDEQRARSVVSFYEDLMLAFRNVVEHMAPNGRACIVVGNRTVKGIRLETDVIMSELLEREFGLRHELTIVRRIPNKVMPSRNSPSNVPGKLGETMTREHILILRKPSS